MNEGIEERGPAKEAAYQEAAYHFKARSEFVWALLVAVAPPLLLALSTFQPEAITDYRVWGASIIAGMIRAGAGFGLSYFQH